MNVYTIITIAIAVIGPLIIGYVLIDEVRTKKIAERRVERTTNESGCDLMNTEG